MKNIASICKKINALTPEEFAEARELADAQIGYNHPLKMGTAARQTKLGRYNMTVINALVVIKKIIHDGPEK